MTESKRIEALWKEIGARKNKEKELYERIENLEKKLNVAKDWLECNVDDMGSGNSECLTLAIDAKKILKKIGETDHEKENS